MSFTLELTPEQEALRAKAHDFARDVIRPAAPKYDRAQEFPWPVLEKAAEQGLYEWELYAQLSMDPTGLSLPILMEELFWGCAGIGLSIVMPALALAAIRQAATDEQLLGGEERLAERIAKGKAAEQDSPPPVSPAEEGGAAAAVQRRSSAALGAFERTRPMVAAQAIGIARAALEFARDYAVSREAFGQPIIENQGVSFPLADIAADIDAARLLTWRAAWMAAQRKPFEHAEGSMSKLKASEVAVRACEQAIQRWAAGATSRTSRSRSGIAMPSSTRSSRAPAKSSGW